MSDAPAKRTKTPLAPIDPLDVGDRPTWAAALDEREYVFVTAYIQTFEGSEAALWAGFSKQNAKQAAYRIKQRSHVRAAIDAALMERFNGAKATIMEELAALALHDPGDYASWTDKTVKIKGSKQLTRRQRIAITSIKRSADGGVELKFTDKQAALEKLAKLTGQMREMPNADSGKFVVFVVEDPGAALRGGHTPVDNPHVIEGEVIDNERPSGSHAGLVIEEPKR